jgi:hypothetical protein
MDRAHHALRKLAAFKRDEYEARTRAIIGPRAFSRATAVGMAIGDVVQMAGFSLEELREIARWTGAAVLHAEYQANAAHVSEPAKAVGP